MKPGEGGTGAREAVAPEEVKELQESARGVVGLQGPGLCTWRLGREPRSLRVMGKSCHGDRVRSELEMWGVAGTL